VKKASYPDRQGDVTVKHLSSGRSEALAALHEISALIVSSLDLDETLLTIARAATHVLDADIGAIFLPDDVPGLIARGVFGAHSKGWAGLRLNRDRGLNAEALRSGSAARIDDYLAIAKAGRPLSSRQVILEEPVRSALAVPVRRRGGPFGTIGVYRRTVEPFDDEDEYLLDLLSQQAGIALDNALAYGELETARNRLQALVDTTDAIWRQSSFEEVAQLVVEEASRLLPRIACLIGVVPPERPHQLVFVAGTAGWAATQLGTAHDLAQTAIVRRVLEEGIPIESQSFSTLSMASAAMTLGTAIDTARLIPLGEQLPDGRTRLGVLGFYREGKGAFGPEERFVMDEFGKRVSISLHHAELLRLAESSRDRLETAIEVAADLSASLDPPEVIRRVLMRAVEAGRADRGVLLRIDGEDTVMEDFYDVTGDSDLAGYRHPIASQPLMLQAVTHRQPVIGGRYDVSKFDPLLEVALGSVRHTATIPLVLDGVVTAAMVLSRRNDHPFLANDLKMFQLIANQAVLALRNARLFAQAQAVTRAQSDFLNMAAHELRTPLSVISGYVSMMEDGTLGRPPRDWLSPLDTLRAKTNELETLISELLIASRLEAGTVPVHQGQVELREAAFAAIERIQPRASLLGARLTHRFPDEPVRGMGDVDHVGRILDNLLNNALSYSLQAPRVTLVVHGGEDTRIEVRDRGPGVPPEERSRIFERFYRIDDPAVRHVPGTGLGLYISRQLAARMGGLLTLDRTVPGKGSTFSLRLPAAQ
jgi:signal transduction histidine kinase